MKTAVLILAAAAPLVAHAANPDIIVTKDTDTFDGACDSDCSLREAIQLANERPGPDRIVLAATTYRIERETERGEEGRFLEEDANVSGDFDVHGPLTIEGKGLTRTLISGQRLDRILHVHPGSTVDVTRVTLIMGKHTEYGGAAVVENGATLSLRYCNVSNAVAGGIYDTSGHAGAIANLGTLTLEGSLFEFNRVDHGDRGGLPALGGAVYNIGVLTVRETRFVGNRAGDRDDGGFGGALYNSGIAYIIRSAFEQNSVDRNGAGTTILNRDGGTMRIENSTITSGATEDGPLLGAVANGMSFDTKVPALRLINVTIVGNNSHGILNYGRLDILNSIVAANGDRTFDGPPEQNCLNVGPNARYSQLGLLRSTDDFTNCAADVIVPNADVFTKVLYPLALNNWTLPTFALRRQSPAVDAAVGPCPITDQRRVTRPRDGDGDGVPACDLGAYERPKP